MPITFNETTKGLLDGKNFATVATLNADGSPQWYGSNGTVTPCCSPRLRPASRRATSPGVLRVIISIFAAENPYRTVEIRGTADLTEDSGRTVQRAIFHKHMGQDPLAEPAEVVRWSSE